MLKALWKIEALLIEGGTAAGKALDAYEGSTGDKVVTAQNFKGQIAEAKKKVLESSKKMG